MVSQLIQLKYYDNIIATKLSIIRKRNLLVDEILTGYNMIESETSFFRFLRLPEHLTGKEFEIKCLEQGVQIFSSERFLVHTQTTKNAVRLSVSGPQTNDELKKGLAIIKNLLEQINAVEQSII